VAAIEEPGGDGEARAGERVARTDPVQQTTGLETWFDVMPLVTRFLRRWLRPGRQGVGP
jgi:antibiotic biosynthesis monooxygenase (ABM) superfamily enzyme